MTFTVGVPAEDAPVTRVDIEIPQEFELHRGVESGAWRVEQEGRVLRYTGGTIGLFQCGFFTIAGEVPTKATLVVPFTTYGADGAVLREFRSKVLNHVDAAQLVYAGTTPDADVVEPESQQSPVIAVAGWSLIALAAAAAATLLFVRRRRSAG